MLRAVLDANVFVSAVIRPNGPPGRLLRLCIEEQAFELVVSDSILEELRRSLAYPPSRSTFPHHTTNLRRGSPRLD